MIICPKSECTGCYACVNICPKHCISMECDLYGELHPKIDSSRCTECNLCVKTCPNNKQPTFYYPKKCYAAWLTDKKKRQICASGGLGTIFSEYVIQKKSGIIFGTSYDDDFTPKVMFTDNLNDLEKFKGSKYVQSVVGEDTLNKIKIFLNKGRTVIFIGTPCQISAAKNFLRKDYNNFICVDLICHGVTPTSYFKDEINYLRNKYKISNLEDIRFRGNDGNDFFLTLWKRNDDNKLFSNFFNRFHLSSTINNKRICYRKHCSVDFYFLSFLLGISLRENCFLCKYSRPDRVSDLTIGDFIGLGKHIPFRFSTKNVSSVTVNTPKGEAFFNEIRHSIPELQVEERDYQERLQYRPSLVEPFKKHSLNSKFRKMYLDFGFVYSVRVVLKKIVLFNKIKRKLRYLLYPYRVPKKIFNILLRKIQK